MAFIPSGISYRDGIVGKAKDDAVSKFDGDLAEVTIAVDHQKKNNSTGKYDNIGTTWVKYSASGQHAAAVLAAKKGDRVQVDGNWRIETRNWDTDDGKKGSAVEARFGDFRVIESKADRPARDNGSSGGDWGSSSESPF